MQKKKGIKTVLACFMIMSMIGMGFTGLKVQEVNASSRAVYMNNIDVEGIDHEIMEGELKEQEAKKEDNFIEILESKVDIGLTGYTLSVGNKEVGTLQTPSQIAEILDDIKASFSKSDDENAQVVSTEILEELHVSKEEVYLKDINKKEEVLEYIKTGGKSFETYTTKPLITVVTTEELESRVKTDYEIEVKEDPNMYDTKKETKVEGVAGENKVVTRQIKHNGKVIEKQIINEEVIKEPINQVIVKGSKKAPKTVPTGSFLMPTRGRLSSSFGQRWGRMHQGIDIAKEHGSDIKAADGGTVSFSGAMGTYGNMIEIDHGNGYKTRYAHCSELLFSQGTKVYKGQIIAKIGSTGRSTGPHLHFEVIKDGVHQNPSKYVE